jgi:acyl carrier protein phosphodiesterase
VYLFLQKNTALFPQRAQNILPYMIEGNWLVSYASIEGIQKVLTGMNKRTKGISQMDLAVEDLKLNYNKFEADFTTFFEDLEQFTKEKTIYLMNK